jgi:nitroreductase
METLSASSLLAALQWRYATKQFDPARKIPADVWSALEEALILTPSSFGLQPWKFVVVTDQAVKESLVAASWKQSQPADCSHHVVFAAKDNLSEADVDHFLQRQVELRGGTVDALAGYRNVIVGFAGKGAQEGWLKEWAIRQAYIAIGNFMTCAAVLGVDTCPMEGIAPPTYDRILGLEGTGYSTVVACAAGYRAATDKYASAPKVRFPASELISRV